VLEHGFGFSGGGKWTKKCLTATKRNQHALHTEYVI